MLSQRASEVLKAAEEEEEEDDGMEVEQSSGGDDASGSEDDDASDLDEEQQQQLKVRTHTCQFLLLLKWPGQHTHAVVPVGVGCACCVSLFR